MIQIYICKMDSHIYSYVYNGFTQGEVILWISLGEIAFLLRIHLEELMLPLQGQKASWEPLSSTQQQGQRCIQKTHKLIGVFY